MSITPEQLNQSLIRWGGPLQAWLRGRCDSPDDVVQETFCRLMQQRQPPTRIQAWLFRVASNLANEEIRRSSRRKKRERLVAISECQEGSTRANSEAEEVRRGVESLPMQLREVVVAKVWGELTWPEIAELLQAPQTTLYRRYEEAIAELHRRMSLYEKENKHV